MDRLESRTFYKKLLRVAIPITIQNMIQTAVNMIDNVMVGQLGEGAIAAVGVGNQYYFLLSLMMFGVVSGGTVLSAQYWGNKDVDNIHKVVGLGLISTTILAAIYTIVAITMPEVILRIFSKDTEVIALGAQYLKAVAPSYVFNAITVTFVFNLRAIGNVVISAGTTLLACVVNIIFNYMLIFGHMGFPALGVQGAGYATTIARIVEMAAMIYAVYALKLPLAVHPRKWFTISKKFVKDYYIISTPIILNETVYAVGMSIHSYVYGQMGTAEFASIQIAGTIEKLCVVFFFGLGNGASIMIGNIIGQGDKDLAFAYAKRFVKLNIMLAMAVSVLLVVATPLVALLFKVSDLVLLYSKYNIYVIAVFLIPRMGNYINVVGILRSGGDTKVGLLLDMTNVWGVGVPMAFIAGLYFKLPIYLTYAAVNVGEVGTYLYGLFRVYSRKWINDLTKVE